jgi:hypothetical protein
MPFKQDAGLRLGFQAPYVKAYKSWVKQRFEPPKPRKRLRGMGITRNEGTLHIISADCVRLEP